MTDLFTLRESPRYPGLFIKKYKRKVFYDNLWNDELKEARGRVFDKDGNVVINPFTKIFNYGENNTTIPPEEECLWVQKINGFMAAATYVPHLDKVIVSTTGSLDSDFVSLAEKYIGERQKLYIENYSRRSWGSYTFLFEICDSSDPHIIEEEEGIYLIGKRKVSDETPYFSSENNEHILDADAISLGCFRPDYGKAKFGDILAINKHQVDEGIVVYSKSGTVLKIKTPYYLATKAIARSKDIFKLKRQFIDEEYYPLIDFLKNIDGFNEFTEEQKLHLIRNYFYGN